MDFFKLKKLNYKRIKTNLQIAIYLLFFAILILLFVMKYKTLHHFPYFPDFLSIFYVWHLTVSCAILPKKEVKRRLLRHQSLINVCPNVLEDYTLKYYIQLLYYVLFVEDYFFNKMLWVKFYS